jgi:drug/metabolite transporter (DMT)-like permease
VHDKSATRLGLLALLAGASGIGFAPIFVRLSEVGPSATAFYRMLFALPFLWLWMRAEGRGTLPEQRVGNRRAVGPLLFAGLCFTGDLAIWHWSLQFTTVANSTLLANFAPLFVTLGAWLVLRERITPVFVIGLALAMAGAGLLVSGNVKLSRTTLFGDAIAVVAAVFYAAYLLTVKRLRDSFSTATIMTGSGVVACAGFLLVAAVSGDRLLPATLSGWVVLIALALVSHLAGQTLIAFGLGHLPASFTAVGLLWQPVVAALAAWALLAEPLSAWQAVGGAVVLAGIAVAGRGRARVAAGSATAKATSAAV